MKSLKDRVPARMKSVRVVIRELLRLMTTRRIITITSCLTITTVVGLVLQSGSEPVCAQGGTGCSSVDTTRTTICHVPPGNPQNAQTNCVANSAVQSHFDNHPEDTLGACPGMPPVSSCSPVTVTQLHGDGLLGN